MKIVTIKTTQRGDTQQIEIESPAMSAAWNYMIWIILIAGLFYLNTLPPSNPVVFSTYQVPVKPLSQLVKETLIPSDEVTASIVKTGEVCTWCVPTVETPVFITPAQNLPWLNNSFYMPTTVGAPATNSPVAQSLARLLMRNEGKVRGVYYDKVGSCGPRGCLTIGYGFCIDSSRNCAGNKQKVERWIGRPITMSTRMTDVEMTKVLGHFLAEFESAANRMFGYLKSKVSTSQ